MKSTFKTPVERINAAENALEEIERVIDPHLWHLGLALSQRQVDEIKRILQNFEMGRR